VNLTYFSPLGNHLWQSTLFAGLAGLLTLALRNNRARVRHWVWLAASLKFVIPLSMLVAMGSLIRWQTAPKMTPSGLSVVMDEVSQPFAVAEVSSPPRVTTPPAANRLPAVLLGVWACGFLGIACAWWIRWRRIRAAVCAGSPVHFDISRSHECERGTHECVRHKAVSSPTLLEPGIFGLFRPVLLLPEGIFERLTPAQLEAVVAHELCHIRHRDNLIAAIHMFVETTFWFHPLVWWIGKRMVEERERACDEEVLRLGSEPRVYAEGILNVCRLYAESALACVSGVTGSNLKRRIEEIMTNRMAVRLNIAQKAVLAAAVAAALAAPVMVGLLNGPAIWAQSAQSASLPRPKFEVASIKRCTLDQMQSSRTGGRGGGGGGGGVIVDPGLFRTGCVTVRGLIEAAYIRYANGQVPDPGSMLKNQPLQGGPDWIDSERYTVDARPEVPQTKAMMGGPMLQELLGDRFKVKVHREIKEVPAYALVVAKSGSHLQVTKDGGCTPADSTQGPPPIVPGQPLPCGYVDGDDDGIKAVGATISSLCRILSSQLHRIVIDKTGLSGLFDYHLDLIVGPPGAPGDEGQTSAAMGALQKLGLRVEPAHGTVEFIVLDHVERPSEN